jgi:hypothetical protein
MSKWSKNDNYEVNDYSKNNTFDAEKINYADPNFTESELIKERIPSQPVDVGTFWADPKNADVIKKACAVYGVNENVCSLKTKESIIRFIQENIKSDKPVKFVKNERCN